MSIFQRSRLMGASVKTIDKHYGHPAHDSEDAIVGLLDAGPDVLTLFWRRRSERQPPLDVKKARRRGPFS